MRRRAFISTVPLISGAGFFPASSSSAENIGSRTVSVQQQEYFRKAPTITEPSREIPVIASPDVLVVGGGPAGVVAALAASRSGASTVLVERYNHLGGLWTGGLVLPLLSTHACDKDGNFRQVIHGIGGEIAGKLVSMGMSVHEVNPVIDPEAGKYVLEAMIKESGVTMLYHCWASNIIVESDIITAVILESKSGRVAIRPRVVIDCTGDGDIFHLAGEQYDFMKYNIGLVHRLGNVDRIDSSKPGYRKMDTGKETPIKSVNWVNMDGEKDQDGTDLFNLSRLQQQYRLAIWERSEKIRSTPGHEEVFLLDTASHLGVRMSRILQGRYTLTLRDSMTYTSFSDVIGIIGAWITVNYNGDRISPQKRPMWQIPYGSLLPKKTGNLLVAGRCFSFEKALVEDARIIGTCMVTGQGAGAAAGVAVRDNSTVQDIDIEKIQDVLKKQNVYFG
ncbi:FAD-dependent oxidoreductase [bacterium]|nr:FAD-dependent oxidoreductase [bacterium]